MKKEKTRNNGTMTESAFFSMLREALRRKSMYWKPRQEAIRRASRKYVGENKRQKIEVQCSECEGWFMQKEVEADHIIPAGSCRTFEELGQFAERLFCEVEGYRILCKQCHQKKTHKKD